MMTVSQRKRCISFSCRALVVAAISSVQIFHLHSGSFTVDALLVPSISAPKSTRLRSLYSTNVAGASTKQYRIRIKQRGNSNANASTNKPWEADFCTSRKTQTKIQSAASNNEDLEPVQCSQTILQTLLDTPSTECNPANIVCALTLSAKTLRAEGVHRSNLKATDEFPQTLIETLGVLQMLVDCGKLSPRQLCNAAWAVAKHVEFDETIFCRKTISFVYIKGDGSNYSSVDVKEQQNGYGLDEQIDKVFDSIAVRMIDHLERIRGRSLHESNNKKHVQTGELAMLLWAYAAAKPRDRPPGWEQPRRMEQVSTEPLKPVKGKYREGHFVTFVSTSLKKDDDNDGEKTTQQRSITSRLFDAAAIAFCLGEGAAALKSPDNADTSMLKKCTWNELSNVAWSFATRGAWTKQSDAMMTFLAREATRRLTLAMQAPPILTGGRRNPYCKVLPRDIVQIAWALGVMESDNVSVGDALVYLVDAINEYWVNNESNESYRQMRYWKSTDLVQLASALAHGRLDNQSVLTAIYEESLERLRRPTHDNRCSFSTSELSILLYVQARLQAKDGSAFADFPTAACGAILNQISLNKAEERETLAAMENIGLLSQEQANLAWSLTVLGRFDENIVLLLQNVFHAASSSRSGGIQLEHAHQLWQSYFILSDDCPAAVKFVPVEFSKYLEQRWLMEKSRIKHSSSRHRAISRTLELLRVGHQNEYNEDVDVAIVLKDDSPFTHKAQKNVGAMDETRARHKIAVEFDGPQHFTLMASTGKDLSLMESGTKIIPRVLGHTVLKYRMLKKKGWTVIRIPYYEWDKIPHWASMERQRYLQRCLKTHQEIQFSGVDISEYKPIPQTRHSRFD